MQRVSPWAAFLIGAGLVAGAWLFAGQDPISETMLFDDDPLGATPLHAADESDARLSRIEQRLEVLIAAMERRGDTGAPELAVRRDARQPTAPRAGAATEPSAQPVITEEVLERTLERLAEKKYAKLTPPQLRAEAQRLIRQAKDMNGARDVLERLLKRDLEPGDRARALTDLGGVHRTLKDYDASERSLRDAMRTAGMDTDTGIQAGYNLVWTYHLAKQPSKALEMADELIANRSASKTMRPWLRWAGARMAFENGNRHRASRDYRALLDEFKGQQAYRQIAKDAVAKLKELEEGPR